MKIARLYVLASIFAGGQASAGCPYITDGLGEKMKEYRAFRDENLSRQARLLETATGCSARSSAVAGEAAEATRGLSCSVQGDANGLDQRIVAIGGDCEQAYGELRRLQEQLRLKFTESKADMDEAVELLDAFPLAHMLCEDDLKVAKTMADAFSVLETGIVAVKSQASEGEADYQRLKRAGTELATLTGNRNDGCAAQAELASAALSEAGRTSRGAGTGVVPAGRSENVASDITGVDRAKRDEAESSRVLAGQK